jgi:hypothetical protein
VLATEQRELTLRESDLFDDRDRIMSGHGDMTSHSITDVNVSVMPVDSDHAQWSI